MPISTTHIWISLDTSLFFFTVFLHFNKKSGFITQKKAMDAFASMTDFTWEISLRK